MSLTHDVKSKRVPIAAACGLAAIAICDLPAQANAYQNAPASEPTPDADYAIAQSKTVEVAPVESIAAPETTESQQFAPPSVVAAAPTAIASPYIVEPQSRTQPQQNLAAPEPTPEVSAQIDAIAAPPSQAAPPTLEEIAVDAPVMSAKFLAPPEAPVTPTFAIASNQPVFSRASEAPASGAPTAIAQSLEDDGTDAAPLGPTLSDIPSREEIDQLQSELQEVEVEPEFGDIYEGSPALTISNPSGFGADNNTGFINFGYQARTRYANKDDGALGIGVGFGDARESVGVQLSYTLASFGTNRDFGTGGFNAKIHRQLPGGWGVAVGWDGFLNVGDDNDFEDSVYGVVSKVIKTREDLNSPFSRVALTAGVGSGRFRSEEDVNEDANTVNVFGSMAVRVARPVSVVAEWTGQDLALGLSIVPFRNFPLVITPALRDVAGAGDGARFVLGTGVSFKF